MFTGIIESLGRIVSVAQDRSNVVFGVASPISQELKIDQSVSHNGVCLTVTSISEGIHYVTAIQETLDKTTLGTWQAGTLVNLERCMQAVGRFDGHIVQGHVDQTGICTHISDENGSWRYTFAYNTAQGHLTVEKGSICVNGVSLTVVGASEGQFGVAIIPYTYEHTNFQQLQVGQTINLEFDIVGKYLQQLFLRQQR